MSAVDFLLELEADQTLSYCEIINTLRDVFPDSELAHDGEFDILYRGYTAATSEVPRLALILANLEHEEDHEVVSYLMAVKFDTLYRFSPRVLVNYPEVVYAGVSNRPSLLQGVIGVAKREHLDLTEITWNLLENALREKRYDLVEAVINLEDAEDNVLTLFLLGNRDLTLKRIIVSAYADNIEMFLKVARRISEEDSVETKRALIGLALNIRKDNVMLNILMRFAKERGDREALLIIADYAIILGRDEIAEKIDKLL